MGSYPAIAFDKPINQPQPMLPGLADLNIECLLTTYVVVLCRYM